MNKLKGRLDLHDKTNTVVKKTVAAWLEVLFHSIVQLGTSLNKLCYVTSIKMRISSIELQWLGMDY